MTKEEEEEEREREREKEKISKFLRARSQNDTKKKETANSRDTILVITELPLAMSGAAGQQRSSSIG